MSDTLMDIATEGADTPESHRENQFKEVLDPISNLRFDPRLPVIESRAVVSCDSTKIATRGNIIALSGQAKHGKSHALSAVMAATMATHPSECDLLGFSSPNPDGKAVIYIDCEQSREHFDRLLRGMMVRANVEEVPEWFYGYNLTGKEPQEIWDVIEVLCEWSKENHGGVHILLIDGFADLISSPNDEGESFEAVRNLHELALEIDAPIIGVLHRNAGSDGQKMRGHLGSQIERKAETVLTCKRDTNGVITLFTSQARNAPIMEQDGPRFEWDSTKGMFATVEPKRVQIQREKVKEQVEKLSRLAKGDPLIAWRHGELVAAYQAEFQCSESTAKRFIKDCREFGTLNPPAQGDYINLGAMVQSAIRSREEAEKTESVSKVQMGFNEGS